MKISLLLFSVVLTVISSVASQELYLNEVFDEGWENRWVYSTLKDSSDRGQFVLTSGKFYNDKEKDKGIQTSQDAKFYAMSAKFPDGPFSNKDKTLVIQFQVKHEQNIDCGGGYVKLFPSTLDPKKMHGDSLYNIMFGPDICGPATKKVHVILSYKGNNLNNKKEIRCKDDVFTHLYTLIVKPDNTYEVKIDNNRVEGGNLEDDWDFLKPKKIKDPIAKKPEDWDDRQQIDDPEDTKPDVWDEPKNIPDPSAEKPDDWDDDADGEWEPPMIDNPDYKGDWEPKKITNPDFKGVWVHPEIDNPDYELDDSLYAYEDFGYIGFDLWQVKSGTIFDHILVTDSIAEAEKAAGEWEETSKGEKAMKDKQDKEEEEKRKQEETEKKKDEVKDDTDTDTDTDDNDEDKKDTDDTDDDKDKKDTDDTDDDEDKKDTETDDNVDKKDTDDDDDVDKKDPDNDDDKKDTDDDDVDKKDTDDDDDKKDTDDDIDVTKNREDL